MPWRKITELEIEAACYRREILRLIGAEGASQEIPVEQDHEVHGDDPLSDEVIDGAADLLARYEPTGQVDTE